jgi:lysophospholipase L1-like esterase
MQLLLFLIYNVISLMIPEEHISQNYNKVNYLALGDSYTIGEGVPYESSFPYQLLHADLGDNQKPGELKVVATTGWTTTNLLTALNKEEISKQWNLVTLLIGVNNQYQKKPFQLYEKEFAVLLDRAIEYAGGNPARVIVVSIPDYGVTPFAKAKNSSQISDELRQYNTYAKAVAIDHGCQFVNITNASLMAKSDKTLLADDQLHPSGVQYKAWVTLIQPIAKDIINDK